jgi:hypothetical protein
MRSVVLVCANAELCSVIAIAPTTKAAAALIFITGPP